jgi:hypothetical protein
MLIRWLLARPERDDAQSQKTLYLLRNFFSLPRFLIPPACTSVQASVICSNDCSNAPQVRCNCYSNSDDLRCDEGKDASRSDTGEPIRKGARDCHGGLANEVEAVNQYTDVM